MPKITINERDLTSPGLNATSTGAVFIPGYANIGPINVPTLCSSLDEFYSTFGNKPYTFRNNQSITTGIGDSWSFSQGAFEQSYVYALETLRRGLPVVYSRVFSTSNSTVELPTSISASKTYYTNTELWTASTTLNKQSEERTGKYFPISYSADGSEKVEVIRINLEVTEGLWNYAIPAYTVINNSGATFTNNTVTIGEDTIKLKIDGEDLIKDPDENNNDTGNKFLIGNSVSLFNELPVAKIEAIYPGAYYENVVVKLIPSTLSTPTKLSISLDMGVTKIEENFNVAFTLEELETYSGIGYTMTYYPEITSELVDIAWKETNLTTEGYKFASITTSLSLVKETTDSEKVNPLELNGGASDEFIPDDIYSNIASQLKAIEDKNEYIIKFITSGSYPTFNTGKDATLLETASERKDCTAIIDAFPSTTQEATDLLKEVKNKGYGELGNFGAMFTPAGWYNCSSVGKNLLMPASFGYITAYANSVQNNPGYLAVAGATRGAVPNMIAGIGPKITTAMIDQLQDRSSISINPITEIKPYGKLIWGNRTLKNNAIKGNLTAQSFLNIRCLLSDLKKVIYTTAKGYTFEQNTDILWINFKAGIVPTLDQMVSGGGLRGYEITKVATTEKAKIKALLRLYAVEAVEDFDVDIELTDSEITTIE